MEVREASRCEDSLLGVLTCAGDHPYERDNTAYARTRYKVRACLFPRGASQASGYAVVLAELHSRPKLPPAYLELSYLHIYLH